LVLIKKISTGIKIWLEKRKGRPPLFGPPWVKILVGKEFGGRIEKGGLQKPKPFLVPPNKKLGFC